MGAEERQTIYTALRKLVADDGLEPDDAAVAVLQGMTKAQLVQFVLPEVRRLARSMRRRQVRRAEDRVFSGGTKPEHVAELVAESFMLPDGRFVTWGAATAEDHEARAAWQRENAAKVVADAEHHERAASMIRDAGVSCLDDLGGPGVLEAA